MKCVTSSTHLVYVENLNEENTHCCIWYVTHGRMIRPLAADKASWHKLQVLKVPVKEARTEQ